LSFLLEAKDFDIYECGICEEQALVRRGDPAPDHCNQPMHPVAQRNFDIAKCPKCKETVKVESTLTRWSPRRP
jgi:hypothetical protein